MKEKSSGDNMAAIHDLLAQIQDEELRSRIEKEVEKLSKYMIVSG